MIDMDDLIASGLFLICFIWIWFFPPWICKELWGDWRPIAIKRHSWVRLIKKARGEE